VDEALLSFLFNLKVLRKEKKPIGKIKRMRLEKSTRNNDSLPSRLERKKHNQGILQIWMFVSQSTTNLTPVGNRI